jgi:hypothetical protein
MTGASLLKIEKLGVKEGNKILSFIKLWRTFQ